MNIADFEYELPPELIAKHPVTPRDHSRLLVASRPNQSLRHCHFYDLPEFLNANDLLVFNDTKVIPARLRAWDAKEREFEIFLLRPLAPGSATWECLARPGKKIPEGTTLKFLNEMTGRLSRSATEGVFHVAFQSEAPEVLPWIFKNGAPPLPPYLKRAAEDSDRERYQTVFAREPGSVAAPTAGLHFTSGLLDQLKEKGVHLANVTLHVSYGTFAPLREETLAGEFLHEETFEISDESRSLLNSTKAAGGKIITVGTTSLRTIESLHQTTDHVTRIFIKPGYQFRYTDSLVTNFHLPRSSLFVLVCALMGNDFAHRTYRLAVEEKYRFYSYGDAMLVL